ncbi:hypothetical protein Bca4012_045837 [Brassica carinata]
MPRSHYPTLSLVSKSFRNLTASSNLYKRRSQLGITQHRVYAVLRNRSTGRADVPSVAAVLLYSYFACPLFAVVSAARSQSPKLEMIDSLFQPVDDPVNGDNRYHETSYARKPKQIIMFRDGVSESQFNQVLNIVVDQIIKAYQRLGETYVPNFTVIVAQKDTTPSCFKLRVMKMFLQEPLWTPRLYKIENTYQTENIKIG